MSLILDLSLRLHGGMRPGECVELARAAEAAGFAGAWFAENPFARGILHAFETAMLRSTSVEMR